MRARVIGSGVSGLTSALCLADAGFEVEIWARDLPPSTTSNVAAAIWYPYKAGPADKVERWARESYARFRELARDPQSGVWMRAGIELLPEANALPLWRTTLDGFRAARGDELPQDCGSGFVFSAPVVEMPVYLEFLKRSFVARGGVIHRRTVTSLSDALEDAPLVVDCAGLGARELVPDLELHAIRGQVVRVERRGIERFLLDDYGPNGLTYVIPRSSDCVLGSTAEYDREDTTPDEATTRAIVERCTVRVPELEGAHILSTAVGLRPGRSSVRVELEQQRAGQLLVHNYGHGGAGVTLSWGCASDVLALVLETRDQNRKMR
jgi:D-amino-acid oxidase